MPKYLKTIIYIGLFLLPVVPFFVSGSFFFPFITSKAFAFRIIIEIILASWAILAIADPQYRPKKNYIFYALIAFLVIIGIADLASVAPIKSFWSNYERMEGYITLLHLGAFFIVITSLFRDREWKWWWNTSIAASFLMSLYGFMQLAGVFQIHQSGVRLDGTLGNASYLAVYMLIHIFLVLFFMFREKNPVIRWLYVIVALLDTIILYYTATRGAILGLLGGLLIMAVLSLRKSAEPRIKRLSIGYIICLVVLVGGFFALRNASFIQKNDVLVRFSEISTEELTSGGRSFIWPMAIRGTFENAKTALVGWGQDNFNYVFNQYYSPKMYNLEPWFDRAHNIFLDWAIAGGLLGLIAYLSLYCFLLYYIWKPQGENAFSLTDKTILTGLIAAYFFHNLFVFDNLISYILFFALLAFVSSKTESPVVWQSRAMEDTAKTTAMPIAIVVTAFVLYFVNVQPILANVSLINALSDINAGNYQDSINQFESAYNETRLGRPEAVEQLAANAPIILASSNVDISTRNSFYLFVKKAVEEQAADLPTDARYQLLAGTFLDNTGAYDEALSYLNKAKELMPGKQMIYFQIADTYINKGDMEDGLNNLKYAYNLAPEYSEAEISYLAGAIYAGDSNLESMLIAKIRSSDPQALYDTRIIGAYLSKGRYADIISLLKQKLAANPSDPQSYITLAAAYIKAGDKADAISTLQNLESAIPSYKSQADQYIQGIQNGTIK